jgi:uncharacterized protein YbjT (DUF2867 family)
MIPQAGANGEFSITMPIGSSKMSGIDVEDIGRCAFGVLQAGKEFQNKSIGVAGEHLTGAEMASTLSKVSGRKVVYNAVPWDVYAKFPFPGADDLANMFRYYDVFSADFTADRPTALSQKLNPKVSPSPIPGNYCFSALDCVTFLTLRS